MRLRYTRRAAAELEAVLGYIAERAPQGAARVQQTLFDVLRTLTVHPEIDRQTSRGGLRRQVVRPYPYLIFYTVGEDEVVIHGVRHAARRPQFRP